MTEFTAPDTSEQEVVVQATCTLSQELAQLRTGAGAPIATPAHATSETDLEDDEAVARAKALEAAERYACIGHDSDNEAGGVTDGTDVACMLAPRRVAEDCESVLSCCSNLYNHPGTISDDRSRRRQKSSYSGSTAVASAGLIQLSSKTGLPITVRGDAGGLSGVIEEGRDDSDSDSEGEDERVNEGVARAKGESVGDKKARKAAVKEAKRVARQRKKENKQVFAAANTSMQQHVASNSRAQRTVVHIV